MELHFDPWPPRRILQLALVLPAFLLFTLNWQQTAGLALIMLAAELWLLPEWIGPSGGQIPGPSRAAMLAYPSAILALTLIFHHYLAAVAAAWALLAMGDGMAGAVGVTWGTHPLPFNREKTWEGFTAFIAFGFPSALLLLVWVSGANAGLKAASISLAAAVAGAFVESLPVRLSDNVTVPLVCGCFIFCAGLVERASLDRNLPYLGIRIVLAVVVNAIFALAALGAGQITRSGAVAGFFLGAAVYMGFGYKSFLVLVAFFAMGVAATRLGYARKAERGIEERRRGARTWREALGNILAASFFAVLVITTPYQSAFLMALVAALAEAAGDTVASEIGKWRSPRAYLITSLKAVAAGVNGGVSLIGTAAGLGASGAVVLLAWALGLCWGWHAAVVLGAAFAGNLTDSVLGATLERRGLLTNSVVNFLATGFAGALALAVALHW